MGRTERMELRKVRSLEILSRGGKAQLVGSPGRAEKGNG
jgi:hypothetical protein